MKNGEYSFRFLTPHDTISAHNTTAPLIGKHILYYECHPVRTCISLKAENITLNS